MRRRTVQFAATSGLALLMAAPAYAQTASNQLGEIVVTARKRQESILNVPVTETVITPVLIERLQVQGLKDVGRLAPGLVMGTQLDAGLQVSMRGVGTTTLDPASEQTVVLNVDGVQMYQGIAYNAAMFDIGQIEVLKGPQSLFYGKSTPGGVIAIRTADPTNEREVIARAGVEFESQNRQVDLILSGPITDTLKVRLAGMYSKQEGYFYNRADALLSTGALPARNKRLGPTQNYTVRGTVLWTPADNFTARFKTTNSYTRTNNTSNSQLVSCPEGVSPSSFGVPFVNPREDCKLNRNVMAVDWNDAFYQGAVTGGTSYNTIQLLYDSLELNWEPRPDISITSVTGYFKQNYKQVSNGTSTSYAAPSVLIASDAHRRDWTQEFRINTDFDGPLNFTGALYYQDTDFDTDGFVTSVIGQLSHNQSFLFIKAISPMAQVRWRPTPKLEIALGARYTDEKRREEIFNRFTNPPTPIVPANPKIRSKTTSPELTVTYKPTDDLTLFGSLKKGFKSGGFNFAATNIATGGDNSYGDERVKGGEIGIKGRLLDRHLTFTTAFFDYRYSGIQTGVLVAPPGQIPFAATINAARARTYGIDWTVSYAPEQVPGLDVFFTGQWNKARFKDLDNVPCWNGQLISEGCNQALTPASTFGPFVVPAHFSGQSLDGAPMIRAPEWQLNFGFNYELPLDDGKKVVFTNSNAYYSRYLLFAGRRPDFYQSAFFTTDLSVALHGKDDRWELALIGKNITDKITKGGCNSTDAMNAFLHAPVWYGSTTRNVPNTIFNSGMAEVACRADAGRAVWLRFSYRPAL